MQFSVRAFSQSTCSLALKMRREMVEVSDDSGDVLHGDPAESLQVDPLRRVAGTGSVPFISYCPDGAH